MRDLPFSVGFYSNFAALSRFWKTIFFSEKPSVYSKSQDLNNLRNLTISFAFNSKFGTLCRYWKKSRFFRKPIHFSKKLKLFERFEKTANFSCILQKNCYLQPFSKKSMFFLKSSPFFPNSSNCSKFLENLTNRVAFYSKFATISDFCTTQIFLGSPIFLTKNSNSEGFEKSHYFIRIRHQIGYLRLVSKKFKFVFQKNHLFFLKNLKFEGFEKSYCFSCIIQQNCYLQPVLENSQFVLKNPPFSKQLTIFKVFWEILLIPSHSTSNLLPLAVFENFKFFSRETQIFCKKKQTFECFEKPH